MEDDSWFKLEIGDLICYNAVGQKHKSLGMVLKKRYAGDGSVEVRVHWIRRGEVLPKDMEEYVLEKWKEAIAYRKSDSPVLWHQLGDWLEVVCK